ncbi:MAG: cell envelope integrity protein CreD [Sphingobacteriales bacterium JAD_PAG50586_3]|nr:MAG: cell envelope integrity protein CreD [Sphingobacteriales bacterium JAD_PAG50586_3]
MIRLQGVKYFQNMSLRSWFSESPTIKLATICALTLLLLIPSAFVMQLIRERSRLQEDAVNEISSKWGSSQSVVGPIVSVPYRVRSTDNNNNNVTTTLEYVHFLPETLDIKGNIKPEIRHRGIYNAVVYNADLAFSGTIKRPDINLPNVKNEDILWEGASVYVGITDLKGVKNTLKIKMNGKELEAMPGLDTRDVCSTGLGAKIDLKADSTEVFNFSFALSVNGTESLSFAPIGKETKTNLQSTWTKPSFTGAHLPETKADVSSSGFNANWNVLYINRSFPQVWVGSSSDIYSSNFGVTLLDNINSYDKTTRSAKYAIMFLALTFLAFFLTEVLSKTKIHIIQYVLVGFALSTFYLLLLSLSEQIGFNMAYLFASIAVIMQITFYASTFVKHRKNTVAVFGVLAALYGFLFTTLQLEDYALLIGSIALFVILSVTMYLSRKVNWSDIQFSNHKAAQNTPPNTEQ